MKGRKLGKSTSEKTTKQILEFKHEVTKTRSSSVLLSKKIPDMEAEIMQYQSLELPRGKYRYINEAISYLTEKQAYLDEGIFRECSNYEKIKEIYKAMESDDVETNDMFYSIGSIGVAELLKTILIEDGIHLINETMRAELQVVPNIIRWSSPHENYRETNFVMFLIESVFRLLPLEDYKLLKQIIEFLLLVIANKDSSKMDLRNIASVFGCILFTPPKELDLVLYADEVKTRCNLLELILTCFIRFPHHVEGVPPRELFAIKSGKIGDQYVLKGERFLQFHCCNKFVYGITQSTVLPVPIDEMGFFTDVKQKIPSKDNGILKSLWKRAHSEKDVKATKKSVWRRSFLFHNDSKPEHDVPNM